MEALKLSAREINYIALFESMTGAVTKDCIIDEDGKKIIFIVKKGDIGIAIGRKGSNVQRVSRALGKKIEIIEYSDDPAEFVANVLHPVKVNGVEIEVKGNKKVAKVKVDIQDKPQAIGRRGKNLARVKNILKRHHGIDEVVIV
ncbi:MAG: NusA-like transcription termination signal-binding factor [Euryarchaeota archaeon]|nr:NusA-like transcription termination signal-binding factor [Euryarchaeota archaeon]